MIRQEGSTSSRADVYRWAKIRIPEFRGGDKWSSYLVQFRTIMKMHWCYDNAVMVFKRVEALRRPALEYYNRMPAETHGQLSALCTLFERRMDPVKCFSGGKTGHIVRYCRSNVQRTYPRLRDGLYVKAAQVKTIKG